MPSKFVILVDKYILFIQRRLFWFFLKITKNPRPTSYPYVSGDSFRALSDHIHDKTSNVNPDTVKKGDIIFVENGLILSYLKEVHPHIKYKYILLEHNGDYTMDKTIMDLLDDRIFRFYAQNAVCEHPRLVPLPLALENLHYYYNGIPRIFNRIRKKIKKEDNLVRKNKIFFNFSINTNPKERGPAKEFFLTQPNMETINGMISPVLHLDLLLKYKFLISPPGNAPESSRTFEGMYIKTLPIVKSLIPTRYYASLGLPVWVVNDWKELEGISEKTISDKYESLIKNAQWQPLFMDFWIKKIKDDQVLVRNT